MLLPALFASVLVLQVAASDGPHYVRPLCAGDDGSGFGYRTDPFTGRVAFHAGLDYGVEIGRPVLAAAGGRVVMADRRGAYGLAVEIDHGGGHRTRYGHLSAYAVEPGQRVAQGSTIGWSGATGRTKTPHLHFEVWRNGTVHDPRRYVRANPRCGRR